MNRNTSQRTGDLLPCQTSPMKFMLRHFKLGFIQCLRKLLVYIKRHFYPLDILWTMSCLTHEKLAWAKQSNQEVVIMKSDFTKACDVVACGFIFFAMEIMGPSYFHHNDQTIFPRCNCSG